MTSTVFTPGTVIASPWLNDVNTKTYADPDTVALAASGGSSRVGYLPYGTNAVATTVQDKLQQIVSVKDFGAKGDGSTSDIAAIAAAIAATPTYGTLYFPPGVYIGYIQLRRSNISIVGAGSGSTILKLPNSCPNVTVAYEGGGTVTGLPNVIEIGEAALGNSANTYTNVVVQGIGINGNKTNNPDVTMDLFGHGIIACKTSYCKISDVNASNCWVSGISIDINSNYAFVRAYVYNCGFSAAQPWVGFDVNSSKYGIFDITTESCNYGARLLDNCYSNHLRASCYNTTKTAFVYSNQTVNKSYANNIELNVYGGCGDQGIVMSDNCFNSTITANIRSVTGKGMVVNPSASAYSSTGNNIMLTTSDCAISSLTTNEYDSYNTYTVRSVADCTAGSAGDNHCVNIYGSNNTFAVNIKGLPVANGRGFIFRSTASNNYLSSFIMDSVGLVTTLDDQGTNNIKNFGTGYETAASGATLPLTINGTTFKVTGTTGIASLESPSVNIGRQVTLIFDGSLLVTTGSGNIRLAGAANFSATALDTLTLASNGTYWIEVCRSVN